MFGIKKRFKNVRAELVQIDEGFAPLLGEEIHEPEAKKAQMAIVRICRILVRVIDALP